MSAPTAAEMIEALRLLPPETELLVEGGCVACFTPSPDDVLYAKDGTPWVVIA